GAPELCISLKCSLIRKSPRFPTLGLRKHTLTNKPKRKALEILLSSPATWLILNLKSHASIAWFQLRYSLGVLFLELNTNFLQLFEHMKNYELLMAKISRALKPTGKLFVHI